MTEFTITGLPAEFSELASGDYLVGDDVSEVVDNNKTKSLPLSLLLAWVSENIDLSDLFPNLPTGSQIYFGWVGSSGTATLLPSGWSVYNATDGAYSFTHDLGHTNYMVFAFPTMSIGDTRAPVLTNKGNTGYFIRIYDDAGLGQNTEFFFILIDLGA